jgi:polysaccharide deacetylase family protein (PEP-CTERM system associated)
MREAFAPRHAFTVDVEDWFHSEESDRSRWDDCESRVEASTRALLELCAEAGVRGTFFVLGWVARRSPGLVRAIAAAGHEIGSHGWSHEFVYRQAPATFLEDVRRARGTLQDLTGAAVRGYRAPYFSIVARSTWAYDALIAAGHDYSSSVFPGANPRYGIPGHSQSPVRVDAPAGGSIWEIPITTCLSRIGCGGVYFRALPYRWFEEWMGRMERAGRSAVFYIHPWELDPGKPRARGSLSLRLRHEVGIRGTAGRLRRLLKAHAFGPLEPALTAAPVPAGVAS